jgi:uncharacterized RDD family membrane protein YckC
MIDRSPARFRTRNVERQAGLQGAPLASFSSRAIAFLVDGLVIVALLALPGMWSVFNSPPGTSAELTVDFGALASFLVAVAYFSAATWLGRGATPGKRLMGIRVVSLVHGHMSAWHCAERALGYAASFLEGGFGFVQYFTHPNHQTVHDRIAETIVVATRRRKKAA